MILWFRHLPQRNLNLHEWKPFIENESFRKHYMKFIYLLMVTFFSVPYWLIKASFTQMTYFPVLLIIIAVFVIHEALHILVIYRKGDISLTIKGVHFWLNTNAILSKMRFWIFMSLPFIGLSVLPAIASFFVLGEIKELLLFISWFNLIISASDIVNSILILAKPNNSVFCRGFYQVK
ncbi:DUF3267 domain-containing protein [Sporosarcina thermotolerans]|uniref:DUF3267 domain-containing protein n=1 Tax=Sporosarcina thermotolerans TaxID=633404 RepID=A0AAW9AG18_9BACL|nr:DUF3267 domain-containing protein [Sporosarcina thermotolerans]MDW0118641.1 DUF3267 domain-containing protein [Sporosarcina thermotolerans]WHT49567.1 DUF3267 domain-containing protein [Sporosarcina thermotolerans]